MNAIAYAALTRRQQAALHARAIARHLAGILFDLRGLVRAAFGR